MNSDMASFLSSVRQLSHSSSDLREENVSDVAAWFCVRTHPKHEHIAAAQLRYEQDVEVFLPRIRYRRATRCGPAWVCEALFRDYVFARFDLAAALRRVRHARSVYGVVHFGDRWPAVPNQVIAKLREAMAGTEIRVIDDTLQPGDAVQIAEGAMCGLEAVVTRVMPAKQRVAVLLEFLGRQTTVEVARDNLTFLAGEDCQRARAPLWDLSSEANSASV
jgi:transcriptional antiterminator RfaH